MEKIQFLREMIKVTISDFNKLVSSDIESIFEKIYSKNITDEDEREYKYEELINVEIEIIEKIQHSREELKDILERADKMFHLDENEWTFKRENMADKLRQIDKNTHQN